MRVFYADSTYFNMAGGLNATTMMGAGKFTPQKADIFLVGNWAEITPSEFNTPHADTWTSLAWNPLIGTSGVWYVRFTVNWPGNIGAYRVDPVPRNNGYVDLQTKPAAGSFGHSTGIPTSWHKETGTHDPVRLAWYANTNLAADAGRWIPMLGNNRALGFSDEVVARVTTIGFKGLWFMRGQTRSYGFTPGKGYIGAGGLLNPYKAHKAWQWDGSKWVELASRRASSTPVVDGDESWNTVIADDPATRAHPPAESDGSTYRESYVWDGHGWLEVTEP